MVEIYFQDLTPEKQKELFDALGGENGNYDVIPIAQVPTEEGEDVNI
jgi:hypothetical protein